MMPMVASLALTEWNPLLRFLLWWGFIILVLREIRRMIWR